MKERLSEAWLLQLDAGLYAAIGLREMAYVLAEEPKSFPVPRTPAHARRVVMWEGQLIPLLDLRIYLHGAATQAERLLVGIVGCTAASGDTRASAAFGAVLMCRAPQRVQVSDRHACPLPDEPARWRSIAASCFKHPTCGPVPILDVPSLLTRAA